MTFKVTMDPGVHQLIACKVVNALRPKKSSSDMIKLQLLDYTWDQPLQNEPRMSKPEKDRRQDRKHQRRQRLSLQLYLPNHPKGPSDGQTVKKKPSGDSKTSKKKMHPKASAVVVEMNPFKLLKSSTVIILS
jgi:hypothetical protein